MRRILWLTICSALLLAASCGASIHQPAPAAGPDPAAQFGPAPAGVDQALWGELTARLASELAQVKTAAVQLPNASDAQVDDFVLDSVVGNILTFSWSFRNPGDYDQNGEINAADLVPIAANFRAKDTDANWAAASIADGNGDGEVNGSDVTEIARYWQNAVRGYIFSVEFADFDQNATVGISDLTRIALCKVGAYATYGGLNLAGDWTTPRLSDSEACKAWFGLSMPGTEAGAVPAGGGVKRFTMQFKWYSDVGSLYFCTLPYYYPGDISGLSVDNAQVSLGPLSNNALIQRPDIP